MLIYYLIVNILWGMGPIFDKVILKEINILTLMLLSSFIYLLILLIISIKYKNVIKKDIKKIKNKNRIYIIIIISVIFLLLGNYGYLKIIENDNASIAAIVTSLYPIITLIIGYNYLNENLTLEEFIGFILILMGIIFINYSKSKKEIMVK
jgi:drug/metabolite transporter (DMT)-like permease